MKNTVSLNTQTSVQETNKQDLTSNKEIIEVQKIEGTPFSVITTEGRSFGAIGRHRITDYYEEGEKVEESLKEITWDRIVQVIWAVASQFNQKENGEQ